MIITHIRGLITILIATHEPVPSKGSVKGIYKGLGLLLEFNIAEGFYKPYVKPCSRQLSWFFGDVNPKP